MAFLAKDLGIASEHELFKYFSAFKAAELKDRHIILPKSKSGVVRTKSPGARPTSCH